MSACAIDQNIIELRAATERPLILKSTRSDANEDAHRDFDGFDVDEELARARRAMAEKTPESVAFVGEAMANIDESISRGGSFPMSWNRANGDPFGRSLAQQHQDTMSSVLRAMKRAAPSASPDHLTAMWTALGQHKIVGGTITSRLSFANRTATDEEIRAQLATGGMTASDIMAALGVRGGRALQFGVVAWAKRVGLGRARTMSDVLKPYRDGTVRAWRLR